MGNTALTWSLRLVFIVVLAHLWLRTVILDRQIHELHERNPEQVVVEVRPA